MTRALLTVGLTVICAVPPASGGAGPLIAAHRGGAALWPENSLVAFRHSVALAVELVELDVHLTRDRQLVVLHDASLERTTTGAGEVRGATLAEIRALRLRNREGGEAGETVPTLEEVLDLVAPTTAGLLVEIKNAPGRGRYDGIEENVLAMVRDRGLAERTVVMSFDAEIVRRVRALDPTIRTSLLVSRRSVERRAGTPVDALGWATAVGASDIGFLYTMLGPELLAAARERGLRVAAWTMNDELNLRRMIDLGVDILITDRPDLAKELRER